MAHLRGWPFFRAPVIAGVLFCASCRLVSCERESTPAWHETTSSVVAETTTVLSSEPETVQANEPVASFTNQPAGTGFRFISYNVHNWLLMDRRVDDRNLKHAPKPESERAVVISLLADQKPDIIGLCEIGTAGDLAEIQASLKAAGIDLPHLHFTGGTDETRHLGLISRFPITSTAKPKATTFKLNGMTYGINRGILDATLSIDGNSFRFLGVHLKSKRTVEGIDQEQMRIHEAKLLRRHVDSILQTNPRARLVVYGDFNDTRPTSAIRSITGGYTDENYLTAIPFRDAAGTAWTHHWQPHDIYSRIDFVFVSRELRRSVDFKNSRIIDDARWDQASDHRPLLAIFR
ncbi:MAG: endonuclease/exonuclease/phosphatase family protein [Verrucomicrobiota bacterium]